MFSNLQNKIDLKRIKDARIEIDNEFAFREDFDTVNQTLAYFEQKKNVINNIIIKEEVIEYENEDVFAFLEENVKKEQEFIYNDESYNSLTEQMVDEFLTEKDDLTCLVENYSKFHKVRGLLPTLMEEVNNELQTELKQYVTGGEFIDAGEEYGQITEGEYDVEALFDKDIINMAKKEHLDSIYTMNWLGKQLVDYRGAMKETLSKGNEMQINNGLKSLDVNDTEEIKNKIKDLQESVRFLKSKRVGV